MNMENRKIILLVEDEPLIALSEQMELEDYNYQVIIANSGKKAVEVFNSNPVDLILMDIDLGKGVNGPEAASAILKTKDIPIVFLSSHTEPEIVKKTESITFYGYVVKNSGITVLDASIKMAFKLFEANKKIEESEIKQKTMISNISDVIGIIDSEGIIKYQSTTVEKWFGWKPEEMVGTYGFSYMHPDDLERVRNDFQNHQLKLDNVSIKVEFRNKCKDGTFKPVEMTAVNLRNNPVINGLLINYRDISEQKLAEDALRKSEEKYRMLTENIQDIVWVLDTETFYFRYVSPSVFKLRGYTPEEIIALPLDAALTPDQSESLKSMIRERSKDFKTGKLPPDKNYLSEVTQPCKDGSIVWTEVATRYYLNQETGHVEAIGVTRDITERKKIELLLREKNDEIAAQNEEYQQLNEELIQTNHELQRAKEKTEESEETYRMLYDSMNEALFVSELSEDGILGNFIMVNDIACQRLGYSREELLSMSPADVNTPNSKRFLGERIQKILSQKQVILETEHLAKDGRIIPVELSTNITRFRGKTLFHTVARDISERKSTESRLKSISNILEYSLNEIYVFDCETLHFLFVNKGALKNLGYSLDEIFNLNPLEIKPDFTRESYLRILNPLLTGEKDLIKFETRHKRKDGSLYFVEAHLQLAEFNEKKAFAAIILDITERKDIEKALHISEEKFRNLVWDMQVGVLLQGPKSEILLSNPKALELLGLSEDQLLGKTSFDPDWNVIHEDGTDFPGSTHPVPQAIETRQAVHKAIMGVYRPSTSDRVWLSVDAEPEFNPDGTIKQVICTFIEITDRKKAEEKINNLLLEKDIILKEVHHRIKNNMNTINSLLALQAFSAKEPAVAEALKDTSLRVQSMALLYNKLYQSTDYGNISTTEYIPALLDEIIANFPNSQLVKLEKKIDSFIMDAKKMQPLGIIINELLTNMMKYAFTGRNSGLIKVEAVLKGSKVHIVVEDNGIGIPESITFENSTGFGLSLVGKLTKQLGGTIQIERNQGAKFILEFEK